MPVFEGRFGEASPTEITDIVDHDVDAAKAIDHRAQKLLSARGIGDVGFDGDAICAAGLQLQKGLLRGGFIRAIGNGHARLIFRETHSDTAADAPAATGNQCHTIAKGHSSPQIMRSEACQYNAGG